jgi:hypothetical protein
MLILFQIKKIYMYIFAKYSSIWQRTSRPCLTITVHLREWYYLKTTKNVFYAPSMKTVILRTHKRTKSNSFLDVIFRTLTAICWFFQ